MATNEERFQKIFEGLIKKRFFVMFAKPKTDAPEMDKKQLLSMLLEHLDYVISLEKSGKLFAAGPFLNPDGSIPDPSEGMFILRVESQEEAERIAREDPYQKKGIRENTIRRWQLNEGSYNVRINYSNSSFSID